MSNLEDIVKNRDGFSDTSGCELSYIYDLMSEMPDSNLLTFLNSFGHPDWLYSFQKRSDSIRHTSIPVTRGDSIKGIIRVYVTNEDSIWTNFFPVKEINNA